MRVFSVSVLLFLFAARTLCLLFSLLLSPSCVFFARGPGDVFFFHFFSSVFFSFIDKRELVLFPFLFLPLLLRPLEYVHNVPRRCADVVIVVSVCSRCCCRLGEGALGLLGSSPATRIAAASPAAASVDAVVAYAPLSFFFVAVSLPRCSPLRSPCCGRRRRRKH